MTAIFYDDSERELNYSHQPDWSVTLELPPSVNACYGNSKGNNGRGRFKTKSYKKWEFASSLIVGNMADKPEFKGRVMVIYEMGKHDDNRKRDCANYEKVLSDFFTRMDVIEDDSLIQCNVQAWSLNVESGLVECHFFDLDK